MSIELALLVGLGMVVGFFAGLLGIGGGGIMVPALTAFFIHQGYDASQVVHMALATSLSCIIFNASISTYSHHKHDAIVWPIVYRMAPFVAAGSLIAALLAITLSSKALAVIFVFFMCVIACQMAFNIKPKGQKQHINRFKLSLAGSMIGFFSALLAIGGGSFTVPFLNWHQINIKKAIATAAALGLPIALAGTLTMATLSPNQDQEHHQLIGLVYWPATVALTLGALITTPFGAYLTHRLPVGILKKVFSILLVLLAFKMYLTLD
ncbi:sulfite exporter TauE/SafE family protein [Marinicella rhabdoformis]|uniref:sulfite exporter TauE/SafE family protein n=1 Tax=Marinicella rhabdoformis TaxID=2580566 RepID=UPI0012AEDF46|nr:sulfite exporter TauE/SafE family protein [Marinicella rhabdoformis]